MTVWGNDWALHREYGLGFSLALLAVILYVTFAFMRARRTEVRFRWPECGDCKTEHTVNLEVCNRGWVKPLDDVNVFVDSLEPGPAGRRQLGWSGPDGPQRVGLRIRAGGHAHLTLLSMVGGETSLWIAQPLRLENRQYIANLTVESKAGSHSARVIIDPNAEPPVKVKRWSLWALGGK